MIPPKWHLPVIVALIVGAVWLLSPILPPFVAALMLAWLGDPLVRRLERAGRSRNTAVLLVFSLTFVIVALILLVILPILWHQLVTLLEDLPRLVTWFKQTALPWVAEKLHKDAAVWLDPSKTETAIREHIQEIGGFATYLLGVAGRSGMALLVFVSNLLLLPILSYYFLRDWPVLIQRVRDLLPRPMEPKVAQLAVESNAVLGGFLRGQLLVMVMLGAIYALGLWLTGLDSGLLIGFIAGLVAFVPYLGATVGVVAAVVASLIQYGDVSHLVWIALVFGVGQLIESYILTPKLVGDRIGLHPVAVIFAIMAGGQLFGFIGVLLALPVAAVVNVLFKHMHLRYLKSRVYGLPLAASEGTPSDEPARPDV
jgi:predicted PurR-regulated permease PerM